jgi:hypothetical protein
LPLPLSLVVPLDNPSGTRQIERVEQEEQIMRAIVSYYDHLWEGKVTEDSK